MLSNLNAAHRQHKVTNNNSNSFIDILAVLLTGGVGIFIALLGLYFDDLPFLIIGMLLRLLPLGLPYLKRENPLLS